MSFELFFMENACHLYILECKLCGLFDDIGSLFHYVQEYSQTNLYDENKHDHLIDQILLQHPYLDPNYLWDISTEQIFQWQKMHRASMLVASNQLLNWDGKRPLQ